MAKSGVSTIGLGPDLTLAQLIANSKILLDYQIGHDGEPTLEGRTSLTNFAQYLATIGATGLVRAVGTSFTFLPTDNFGCVSVCQTAAITATMPLTHNFGDAYTLVDTLGTGGANPVTLQTADGSLLNGAPTQLLNGPYFAATIRWLPLLTGGGTWVVFL
jgi:hypothetical protein